MILSIRTTLLFAIPSLIFSFLGCTPSIDSKKLENEIYDLVVYSEEVFESKDLDGLVSRFTDDGSLKITGAPLLTGHEALRNNYKNAINLKNFKIKLDVKKVEIANSGEMAFVVCDYDVSFDVPDGHIVDRGISLFALKRINNKWKIAAENLSGYLSD